MTLRESDKRVTFLRPFTLEGLKGTQPSGSYSVETREKRTGFFSFLDAGRTSTWIRICRNPGVAGALQFVNIDPLDLQAALMRDAMSGGAEKTKGGALPRRVPAGTSPDNGAWPADRSAPHQVAEESLAAPDAISPRRSGTAMTASPYPKLRNDRAVPEIRIGVREFNCIGVSPPHDHPHVYIKMGDRDTILCPYCATRYRHDPRLEPFEVDPPDSLFVDPEDA